MTPESLAAAAGLALSLALAYVPGLKDRYAPLSPSAKAQWMGLLLVIVAGVTLAYNCQWETACITSDWKLAFDVLVAALVANQATYLIAVRPFAKAPPAE